jgi:hypothetical protein
VLIIELLINSSRGSLMESTDFTSNVVKASPEPTSVGCVAAHAGLLG